MNLRLEQLVNEPSQVGALGIEEIQQLISDAGAILEREPKLVTFDREKILFVGDTHGDLESTIPIVKRFLGGGYDGVVFLGDYVDRGLQQIENMNYLLVLKILYPDRVLLLRGNHETPLANRYYGFLDAVATNFSVEFYNSYSKLFSRLPYACIVNGEILCLHGGLAKGLNTTKQIENLPSEVEVSTPILFQLLWNDPRERIRGFAPSDRGDGIFFFGKDVYETFAKNNSIKFMIRAHEVFQNGFRWYFDGKILSLFSANQYTIPVAGKIAELTPQGDLTVITV
ncbi:MAG: metallophosphoesterase [Candidatus Freyarchaeota archaeon]|nr:metallophosphoesterase [Candidatus Jordarchaeia archaeon]MBS7267708.1 metallophosphoesterase [Candidatus Jordarchaeia archaeon]MBS7278889.1 metallophosphoesterase [Candidatus Jordarchaeia archaeon]